MVAAAFFDVDRTLVAGSSLLAMVRPLRRAGLVTTATMLTSALRQAWFSLGGYSDRRLDTASVHAADALRGQDHARLAALAERFVPEIVVPRIYPAALRELRNHREAGHRVYLVSSSPIEIVGPLAAILGVDGFIGTVAEVGPDGRLTGALTRYCSGPDKAAALAEIAARDGIDLAASWAYGDSASDRFMLARVGHPVAANPDRRLRRLARALHWEVRQFGEPRRPSRSARPRPGTAGVVPRDIPGLG